MTTKIASGLLLLVLAAAQFCGNEVYLQTLRRAIQLTGEQPPPDFSGVNGEDVTSPYAARTGHTGS